MTIKKNYVTERDDLRHPKKPPRESNKEKERIKHALRHGDISVLEDEADLDDEYDPVEDWPR